MHVLPPSPFPQRLDVSALSRVAPVVVGLVCLVVGLVACLGRGPSATTATNEAPPGDPGQATTLLFARHAEKARDAGDDPPLTAAGIERANALVAALGSEAIDAIYVTPLRRTRATARPLAEAQGLAIREHRAQDAAFAEHLLRTHAGQTVLVIGHSNTLPVMLDALLDEQRYAGASPIAYGELFVVTVRPGTRSQIQERRFGARPAGGH